MTDDAFGWFVTIGVFLAAVTIVIQTVALFALNRLARTGVAKATRFAGRAEPFLEATARALRDNEPKIREYGDRAVEIARSAREGMAAANGRVTHAIDTARRAVRKADEGIDAAVETTGQAVGAVRSAVVAPVREARGVINGLRAALAVYRHAAQGGNGHLDRDPAV